MPVFLNISVKLKTLQPTDSNSENDLVIDVSPISLFLINEYLMHFSKTLDGINDIMTNRLGKERKIENQKFNEYIIDIYSMIATTVLESIAFNNTGSNKISINELNKRHDELKKISDKINSTSMTGSILATSDTGRIGDLANSDLTEKIKELNTILPKFSNIIINYQNILNEIISVHNNLTDILVQQKIGNKINMIKNNKKHTS